MPLLAPFFDGDGAVIFMRELFDDLPLPGLRRAPSIISLAEEAELVARMDDAGLSPFRYQQWTGRRLTRSYGWAYDFGTGRLAPTEPLPDWLAPLKRQAALFAGLQPDDLVQALLTRYDPGAGIGWHKDRPVFGDVVGVSLGAAATMRFRRRVAGKFQRVSALLEPRSAYHLSGAARHDWEHSIAPQEAARWSITFRSLSPGSAAAQATSDAR